MDFIKLLIASHIYLMLLGTEIFKMLLAGFIMVACMWLVGFIAIWIVRDFKTAYNGIKPTKSNNRICERYKKSYHTRYQRQGLDFYVNMKMEV